MFANPPKLSSIIIRTNNIEIMENFYFALGMGFNKYCQDNGFKKFNYINDSFKFELLETKQESETSKNLEFELIIDEIDGYLDDIKQFNLEIIAHQSGSHLIFKDPDGNRVTLTTK